MRTIICLREAKLTSPPTRLDTAVTSTYATTATQRRRAYLQSTTTVHAAICELPLGQRNTNFRLQIPIVISKAIGCLRLEVEIDVCLISMT